MLGYLSFLFPYYHCIIGIYNDFFQKYELEQMFRREKSRCPFHICNLLIISMVSMAVYVVMMVSCFRSSFQLLTTIGYFYIHHPTGLS